MPSPLARPRTKDYDWMSIAEWNRRRQRLLAIPKAERQDAQLVFLGDSITEGWDDTVWAERFAPYGALRLGIGGDTTANVLYRMEHGELDHVQPGAVVLLIGTNDLGNEGATPAETAAGIRAIVTALRARWPDAHVVLLALLPREQRPDVAGRRSVEATNRLVADLGRDPQVHWVDLSAHLLEPDGTIAPAIMADFLHPTPVGYQRIADALDPLLAELLGEH
jgi:lysophospholipase L1-like esterase